MVMATFDTENEKIERVGKMKKKHLSKVQAGIALGANLLFVAIGVTAFLYGTHVVQKVEDAKQSWSNVEGEIVQSGLRSTQRLQGQQGRRASFILDVHYKYYVDGVEFECDKVGVWNFGGSGGGENRAEDVAECYKKGDKVQVLYNPNNPSDAMLEPDLIGFWWLHIPHIFGVAFLLGGLFRVVQYAPLVFRPSSPFQAHE